MSEQLPLNEGAGLQMDRSGEGMSVADAKTACERKSACVGFAYARGVGAYFKAVDVATGFAEETAIWRDDTPSDMSWYYIKERGCFLCVEDVSGVRRACTGTFMM